jgi:hypothetical protein
MYAAVGEMMRNRRFKQGSAYDALFSKHGVGRRLREDVSIAAGASKSARTHEWKESNKHDYKHSEISKEGQMDEQRHRGRNSMDHDGEL